jgi:hypothetical protein
MDRLELLFLGFAAITVVVSLAHLVTILIVRRRVTTEGLVDEAELEGIEFPQILKPGLPENVFPRGFESLGLHADATADEIRAAYRHLAIQVHPDHGGDAEDFMRLQEDFEHALSHAERHSSQAV